MLFFDKDLNKTVVRKKALNYKSLVIEDTVNPGDEVDIQFNEDGILLAKSDREKPTFEEVYGSGGAPKDEPDFLLVVKEFGVFKDVPNEVQLILCDEYMLVDLIKGAIIVELDGNMMMITRGNVSVPNYNMNNVLFLNPADLSGYVCNWHKDNCRCKYTQDYLYSAAIKGTIEYSKDTSFPARSLTIGKIKNADGSYADPIDISGGKIAFIAEKEADSMRSRAVKSALRTSVKSAKPTYEDDFADFGDDDDFNDFDSFDEVEDEDEDSFD